jgi:hypothetical protein
MDRSRIVLSDDEFFVFRSPVGDPAVWLELLAGDQ